MKLLIKFPTRARPDKFFHTLDLYVRYLSRRANYEFCVTIDDDDASMNCPAVRERLETYPNLRYFINPHESKVDAINADVDRMGEWDILLLASDDMIPVRRRFDRVICRKMKKHFPDLDGVLWFFDGHARDLNTLSIMGRTYYDRFGWIYNPVYRSHFCDNEFMQVADHMGKQVFIDKVIIEHQHPDWEGYETQWDALYEENNKGNSVDRETFQHRQANAFFLET